MSEKISFDYAILCPRCDHEDDIKVTMERPRTWDQGSVRQFKCPVCKLHIRAVAKYVCVCPYEEIIKN
jgi:transposase